MITLEEILLHSEECSCFLFEKECFVEWHVKDVYMKPFWNYIKYRVNHDKIEWKAYFCNGSCDAMRKFFLSNFNLWCEKTIFYSIKENINCKNRCEIYQRMERYSLEEYVELWKKYAYHFPKMIEIILIWVTDFLQRILEMVLHISYSYKEIGRLLRKNVIGKISSIQSGISDIHDGKSVHIITFEDNSKIVYKPRSLALDIVWNNYIRFLSKKANIDEFPTYECLDYGTYGFAEFIESQPVLKEDDFKEYFFHCGFLLGAVYFLQGSDFHSENMIAYGKYPILVDVETVVRSGNIGIIQDNKKENGKLFEQDSVIKTNLLPFLSPEKYLKAGYDAFTKSFFDTKNLPYTKDGMVKTAREYTKDVLAGFSAAYDTLLTCSTSMFQENGVLYGLKNTKVRFLCRNTAEYARYLAILSKKECLMDSAVFSEKLEYLNTRFSNTEGKRISQLEPFLNEEKKSLGRGYIPRFSIGIDETLPNTLLKNTIWEYLKEKCKYINQQDKQKQCQIIKNCLSLKKAWGQKDEIIEILRKKSKKETYKTILWEFMDSWIEKWGKIKMERNILGYIVNRDDYHYYYYPLEHIFSEGFLGITLALAAWYEVSQDSNIISILKWIADNINNWAKQKSYSVLGSGLTEGLEGLCLVSKKVFEMTNRMEFYDIYTKTFDTMIKRVIDNISSYGKDTSLYYSRVASILVLSSCMNETSVYNIRILENLVQIQLEQMTEISVLKDYGLEKSKDGIYLSLLSAMPYVNPILSSKIETMFLHYISQDNLSGNHTLYSIADGLAGHILLYCKKGMECKEIILPYVKNKSFAYGSAGILYTLDELALTFPNSNYREWGNDYAYQLLSELRQKDGKMSPPFNEPFPSFQHGEGGIVYSLVRHLNPEKIQRFF